MITRPRMLMMGMEVGVEVMMGSTEEITSNVWSGNFEIFFLNKKEFYTCELNFFKREITMIWDWAKTIVRFVYFWGLNNIATE
jgi:hypothetical protein